MTIQQAGGAVSHTTLSLVRTLASKVGGSFGTYIEKLGEHSRDPGECDMYQMDWFD